MICVVLALDGDETSTRRTAVYQDIGEMRRNGWDPIRVLWFGDWPRDENLVYSLVTIRRNPHSF
jgi:hypothetical protein